MKKNLAFLYTSVKLGYFLHLLIIYLQIKRVFTMIQETKPTTVLKIIKQIQCFLMAQNIVEFIASWNKNGI